MIEYPIGTSGQTLVLTDRVLQHLHKHRQLRQNCKEAGGQLFARLEGSYIIIEEATGPRRTDRRTRVSYIPNRVIERAEIQDRYARGLHFVGDWHTHATAQPEPSDVDVESMAECFARSHHQLGGFILVIAGQAGFPQGLHVTIHNGQNFLRLLPRFPVNLRMIESSYTRDGDYG